MCCIINEVDPLQLRQSGECTVLKYLHSLMISLYFLMLKLENIKTKLTVDISLDYVKI